ncbi:MAG: GIY-YIG nuclease family protein [Candidatus Electryoneaceae bacterium]|nr:GIY-YIG nuclease family protein [Candidatus Electryoneaceae bacterium]
MSAYYIYILAGMQNGTLYIGVTRNLIKRVYEHRNGMVAGFTKKYSVKLLVYYESTENVNAAIVREKQLKKWERQWKLDLIESVNPHWDDLYDEIIG